MNTARRSRNQTAELKNSTRRRGGAEKGKDEKQSGERAVSGIRAFHVAERGGSGVRGEGRVAATVMRFVAGEQETHG